jgi:hypothetical protein
MATASRESALVEFRDLPEKKILIASLKAGGQGLNLAFASRVICVDLWWNNSVEQQVRVPIPLYEIHSQYLGVCTCFQDWARARNVHHKVCSCEYR